MRKKQCGTLALTIILATLLTACQTDNTQNEKNNDGNTTETATKVVTDQLGREVTIPAEVTEVAMGGILPYFSTWYVATNSTKEIVGMHPNSYNAAKNSILADISPDVLKAKTSYIQNGEINIEELLKVNPQIYFEISTDEKSIEKLTEAGIPTIAVKAIDAAAAEPLATFNSWLELTGQITGTNDRINLFLAKGKEVQEELDLQLDSIQEEDKPRVLFLHQHSEKNIVVGGSNFFSSQWLKATGAINVAEDVQGMKEVNMEQIYSWNPDIIYITNFTETQPIDLLQNQVSGQDWSQVKAVQDKKVYKIPLGIYRWFPPSGDAPLMLKWLAQNNHPDLFTYDMKEEIKNYYAEFYEYTLTDEEIERILHPSSDAAMN